MPILSDGVFFQAIASQPFRAQVAFNGYTPTKQVAVFRAVRILYP